ncbi:MAG: hypothetical protein AAGG02_06470 [Cyanobacteria bacterium P01_H01_bin.15]
MNDVIKIAQALIPILLEQDESQGDKVQYCLNSG